MNKKLRDVKKRAQQSHFFKRAQERLGYSLSKTAISGLRNAVRGKHGTLLAQPSLRISIWSVRYGERDLVVVYDHETEELVTLMTTGMYQEMAICNSPRGKDADDLKTSIADTPAGKALQAMKEQLNG